MELLHPPARPEHAPIGAGIFMQLGWFRHEPPKPATNHKQQTPNNRANTHVTLQPKQALSKPNNHNYGLQNIRDSKKLPKPQHQHRGALKQFPN
jgi:hypothetical protein